MEQPSMRLMQEEEQAILSHTMENNTTPTVLMGVTIEGTKTTEVI